MRLESNKILVCALCIVCLMSCNKQNKNDKMASNTQHMEKSINFLVGTYTSGSSEGIYSVGFNPETGELKGPSLVTVSENPSFLALSEDGNHVYAVNENIEGGISAYKWNDNCTKLLLQNKVSSGGKHPCYVTVNDNLLAAANYSSGNFCVYELKNGTMDGEPVIINHEGSSVIKPNQDEPHAHCAEFSADEKFLYVADLGIDQIVGYPVDKEHGLGEKYNYIAIEGNIGSGKTSLAKKIGDDYNAKLVLERFADNPFLPKFYEDEDRYAFPLEMSFLADRYHQLSDDLAQFDLFKNFIVSDYFIFKSLIFAQITLSNEEYNLYRKMFDIMYKEITKPDVYVFLYQNTDRLIENIKIRGRAYEQNIKPDYLDKIHKGYLSFIKSKEELNPLIIDVSQLDFVHNDQDYQSILKQILEFNPTK
jgi:deoxyadenosine/deoxycytidine kinase